MPEQTNPKPLQPTPKASSTLGSQPKCKASPPWKAKYSDETMWPTAVPETPQKPTTPATPQSDSKEWTWSGHHDADGWKWNGGDAGGWSGQPDKRWATAQEVQEQERKRAVAWQLEELRQAEERVKKKKLEEEELEQKKAKEDQAKATEPPARQTQEEPAARQTQQPDQYQQGIAAAQAQFQTAAAMSQQAQAMWQMEQQKWQQQQQWQQQQWQQQQWQQQQDQWRPNRHGWPKQDLRDEGRYKRLVEQRNQLQKEKVDLEEQLAAKERGYSGEGKRSCSLTKKRCEKTSLAFRGRSKS